MKFFFCLLQTGIYLNTYDIYNKKNQGLSYFFSYGNFFICLQFLSKDQ